MHAKFYMYIWKQYKNVEKVSTDRKIAYAWTHQSKEEEKLAQPISGG